MSQLSKHLRADEKVLWSGKPVKTPFILPSLATIPFRLILIGFAIFLMWGAASAGVPGLLSGLTFVLIVLGLTVGPSIWRLMRYQNTEYMITDQRIIKTGAIGLCTSFVDLDRVQGVYVHIGFFDKMFGTGTVFVLTGPEDVGENFAAFKEPYEVQKLLQEAIERARMARTR